MGREMWMTSCPEAMGWGFWLIFEKRNELRYEPRRSELIFGPGRGQSSWWLRDAPRVVGSDGAVSIVKIVCLSLSPRVENLKVKKVIKVSYLNYRESSVFWVFRESCERSTYHYYGSVTYSFSHKLPQIFLKKNPIPSLHRVCFQL